MPFRGLIAGLVLLLAGCQTLPPPQSARQPANQQLDVPFIAQEKYQCGPAALGMMLQWNGLPGDAEALVDEVWLPERKGSLGIELMAAGRARGLLAYPVNRPEALFSELQAGHPVLILQNLALKRWPQWHFAVVTGYGDGGGRLILHSGTREATTSHWNRFIRTWARADYWGMVLLPAGELPASVRPGPLLHALAPQKKDALRHWRTAASRFPNDGKLQFAYANALWQAGRKADALEVFEKTVTLSPTLAPAWNNLAYARFDQGHRDAAREAVCQAHTLAPDDVNIKGSVAEITDGAGCP
ncbi:PA2778 family cysteine peptidase [Alloalcanivorax xenomutans]|uniref:PA2778 family cysteine peptidase n=1 Tax=Alloalcanivorax xenomutans TaxID=1094342 RepID=UPI0024E2159A|nr:PA2778 family cysteine peptidase [Alloalcanivorax xenomutans]